jgi:hypothetical protein
VAEDRVVVMSDETDLFVDAHTTVDRSNALLAGSANFVSAGFSTLRLIAHGGVFYECGRSGVAVPAGALG